MRNQGARNCKRVAKTFLLLFAIYFLGVNAQACWSAEKGYPDRPINMVVPYAPGGIIDLSSRIVADKIEKFLGNTLVSVHKPGGGGSLGASFVAKAKPDGYTILAGSATPIVLSPIVKKLDYRYDDFIPVGVFGKIPILLAVKSDARWKTLGDFCEEAKKNPGQLKISSYGKLTAADFVIELMSKHKNIKFTHVPYKSSGEALTAVIGGHADAAMVAGAGGLSDSGTIRVLAVAVDQRLDGWGDIPTFKEFGIPINLANWSSMVFPKGTPKEIVEKFSSAQEKAFKEFPRELKEGLRKVEMWVEVLNVEDTKKLIKSDHELISKIAEELGVTAK